MTEEQAVTAMEEAKILIRNLQLDLKISEIQRNEWELKYWRTHSEVRKANRGVQRLVYWKYKNEDMIRSVRGEARKHRIVERKERMTYSPMKSCSVKSLV